MPSYELHHSGGDWSAVYKDGKLVSGPGDTYLRIEYLLSEFGVKEVDDDAFILAGNGQAAQTLDKVEEYMRERDRELDEADEMHRRAAAMIEQAAEMRKKYKR